MTETTNLPVRFSVTDAAIARMEQDYAGLRIQGLDDRGGFALVHEARMQVKAARCDVESTRKALKADALEWGRKVDAEAKRITARLMPIEERLQREEDVVNAERERIRKAKEEEKLQAALAEERRKAEILQRIDQEYGNAALGRMHPLCPLAAIEAEIRRAEDAHCIIEVYAEFAAQAEVARRAFLDRAQSIAAQRRQDEAEAEIVRQEAERLAERNRAEAERLAADRKKLDDERAALKAKQERLDEEKRKADAVETARHQIEAENERQREIKAELDAQRSDSEKLRAYGQALLNLPRPTLGTAKARRALERATELLRQAANLMLAAKGK